MHKTIFNSLLFFLILNFSCAQNPSLDKGRITTKNYYTEIPYEDVNGKLIIPVTIKNKTYRFLFDTGAPNLISTKVKKDLNINSDNEISVSDANSTKEKMGIATLPYFTLGNITFKNTTALVYNDADNFLFNCLKIDGIIGSNVLKKSIVQISSKKNLIIITNSRKKLNLKKQNASKLKLVGGQKSPYIPIKLIGEKSLTEYVLFDTGASGFYDLCLKHYKTFKPHKVINTLSEAKGAANIGLFGVEGVQNQYRVKIPKLSINGTHFNNVITVTESDNNSRVGSELLDYGDVTLDFKNKKIYFHPFETELNLDEKLLGFKPTLNNKKLIVGFVWDEALKDKIAYGDQIIEVNGINFESINICDFITKESIFKEINTLDISFKNSQGEINKIRLKKQ
ncbi:retropepsin-like aspartic protease [Gelatiniphilus marinus]|uniref:Retropepsin-like aspartic protease n=1 Tax=Gelatiniphilus marinus TaxID=1759464 RepID=A0ABW5JSA4_9FLAO